MNSLYDLQIKSSKGERMQDGFDLRELKDVNILRHMYTCLWLHMNTYYTVYLYKLVILKK